MFGTLTAFILLNSKKGQRHEFVCQLTKARRLTSVHIPTLGALNLLIKPYGPEITAVRSNKNINSVSNK